MMKRDEQLETRTPTTTTPATIKYELQPRPFQNILRPPGNTMEEAARAAIDRVADAEDKAAEAAQAVELAERLAAMEDETKSLLEIATHYFELCKKANINILL